MDVEKCTLALLRYYLPIIDKNRDGECIDIGVGTFDFYCELFAKMGFDTIAIEPLPTSSLIDVCKDLNINLIKSCVSESEGQTTIYIGTYKDKENLNLSSLDPTWWGASSKSMQVDSITLDTILTSITKERITCVKIDVEGVEIIIIRQLKNIPDYFLPDIIVFEYGGGSHFKERSNGWSDVNIANTIECLKILKNYQYRTTIQLDSSPTSVESVFDLTCKDLTPNSIFFSDAIYGNFICMKNDKFNKKKIKKICSQFYESQNPKFVNNSYFKFLKRIFSKIDST